MRGGRGTPGRRRRALQWVERHWKHLLFGIIGRTIRNKRISSMGGFKADYSLSLISKFRAGPGRSLSRIRRPRADSERAAQPAGRAGQRL